MHEIYKHVRSNEIDSTTLVFQKLHDYLLREDFPSNSKNNYDNVGFNYHVKTLLMDEGAPEWEKFFTHTLSMHLVSYGLDTGLTKMARVNCDFRQSFHKVMAQRTCLQILKDETLSNRVRDLLEPFKELKRLTSEETLSAIKAIMSDGLRIEERVQVYQFVNAASTFVDPVTKLWNQEIQDHKVLPLPLALVWSKLYPTLEPDGLHILKFEFWIFYKRE